MKDLQTLLFATAAGLLAIGAASAAEQHTQGNPAGHVKNCGAYGAGFHYVPGAGVCMKIGGWAQAQTGSGGLNWGALNDTPASRAAADAGARTRGYITTDVRKQTGFGTVRAYFSVGATRP